MNRRELLAASGSIALSSLLGPVKALAADVKPIRIKNIENFLIEIPATEIEVRAGVANRMGVTRVETESGVRGYSFGGRNGANAQEFRQSLIGTDLFAMEQHLKKGLINHGGMEEALWDTIGRVVG